MALKHKIPSLKTLAYSSYEQHLNKDVQQLINKYKVNSKQAKKELKGTTAKIKTDLKCVPTCLHNELCKRILCILVKLGTIIEGATETTNQPRVMEIKSFLHKIANNLIDVISELYITEFSCLQVPEFCREKIHRKLHKMKNLRILEILLKENQFWYPGRNIKSSLENMSNLTKLTYKFECSDNIIKVLAKNCKNLTHLDISYSNAVTNNCIQNMMKLQKLQELKVRLTGINLLGYKQLLIEHPSLFNIIMHIDVRIVLKFINETTVNVSLNLKIVKSGKVTTQDLKLIDKFCPKLLALRVQCNSANFAEVKTMFNLRDICISHVDFYEDGLNKFLDKVGRNLETLFFQKCINLDYNAMITIAQMCPNLKMLRFDKCQFSSLIVRQGPTEILKELISLEFYGRVPASCYQFFMSKCRRFEILILINMGQELNDADLKCVLNKNPMASLQKIIIDTDSLSSEILELWGSKCKSLDYVFGSQRLFRSLQQEDVIRLKEKIPLVPLAFGTYIYPSYEKWYILKESQIILTI